MNNIDILYTCNDAYFPHMLTSICSLMENSQKAIINANIIVEDLTADNFQKLELLQELYPNLRVSIHPISCIMDKLNKYDIPTWRGTKVANARLFARDIFQDSDKMLYLDSDTIILNPLDNVFNLKINSPVAAVKEFSVPKHMKGKVATYYNSGVLLFDFNKWDESECSDRLYSFSRKHKDQLIYPDQDLLNLAFDNQIDTLSVNYNIHPLVYYMNRHNILAKNMYSKNENFYSHSEVKESLETPVVLHLLEYLMTRTWEKNRIHPYNSIYDSYRKIWDSDYKKEPSSSILAYVPGISLLKAVSNSYMDDEKRSKIKAKIKIPKRK